MLPHNYKIVKPFKFDLCLKINYNKNMTILDATHKLFDYFGVNHTFSMDKNFKDIIPISEEKELDIAIVRLALEDMEKNEIVRSTKVEEDECYILARPMESFEQNVSISHPTAFMITQALNDFCEIIEDYTDIVDVSNVTEKDIRNLVLLNQHHKAEMAKYIQGDADSSFGDGINFDNA